MVRKILRLVGAVLGAALGSGLVFLLLDTIHVTIASETMRLYDALLSWALIGLFILGAVLFAIIFYIFTPKCLDAVLRMISSTEEALTKMPLADIFFAVLGLIIGLLIALLLSTLVSKIPLPWVAAPISILLYVLFGYLGVSVTIKRRSELGEPDFLRSSRRKDAGLFARPKILDTSVIIDGRILDICQTGILEGKLIVPNFVLQELRHIADSADSLKRGRGRRGLDILHRMQKELALPVHVETRDYDDIAEVDAKLLKLAQDMGGVVVTNDYNLNKVASVQNVPVFNINELANAIKPVVLPGEEMTVSVVKEGKEAGQGVGYLDDGTMIVVESGRRYIGETVESIVTSVLQTAAGRMIFAKLK